MSNYLTAAKIAENQQWVKRVGMAAINAAVDILSESDETADHAARAALSVAVIRGDQVVLAALPKVVLSNETVRTAAIGGSDLTGESVSDGDLEFTLASIWTPTAKSLFGV